MSSTAAARQITNAYGEWATALQQDGWTPYLLTLMFRQLRGSPTAVARQMEREAERVYGRFVTRVHRNPMAPSSFGRLPVWICSPDFPVFKHAKQSLDDVTINAGRHLHTLSFQPPPQHSRLREPVDEHFTACQNLYVRPDLPLLRLHAVPITHSLEGVVDYALKALRQGLIGDDGVFVLPRSRSEMPVRSCFPHGPRG
ncbi:hypothetical protein [Methylobacterium longum]|uniref:Uncharacterized protein n=1 Tax=Methylobacterium longum TaxID=767694 RepID=A0ABT8AL99_9HYPH|nr:hypothetical protein [Methylobacterium longum]MDN3570164.1 hypothetical protein [Methylobacterium longum]GJE12240.1 hypothetical protein FOHLNKBM_3287 [Methylobacterium longum]